MKAYEPKFFVLQMADGSAALPLRAVYHLCWLNLHLNAFFSDQEISETFVLFTSDLPEIITSAELQEYLSSPTLSAQQKKDTDKESTVWIIPPSTHTCLVNMKPVPSSQRHFMTRS